VGLLQAFTVGIDQIVYFRVQPPCTAVLTLARNGANTILRNASLFNSLRLQITRSAVWSA